MRLRRLVFALALVCWATSAQAAITFISRAATTTAVNATSVSSPAQAHSAGNLLVAAFNHAFVASATVSGVTNTAGDTWIKTPLSPQAANPNRQDLWYSLSTLGNGSDIVTATMSVSENGLTMAVYEFNTSVGTWSFVVDQIGSGVSGTAVATASLTLTQSSVIVAVFEDDAGLTPTAGTGYTLATPDTFGGGYVWDEYHITAASEAATATGGASAAWSIIAAAFTASAGGTVQQELLLGVGR